MIIPLKKYLIPVLLLTFLEARSASTSPRRLYLDSMNQAIQKKIGHLDSTIPNLDHIMDSITDKQTQKLDTLTLYEFMIERRRLEQRQKEMLYIKLGVLFLLVILAMAGWGRWKKRRSSNL